MDFSSKHRILNNATLIFYNLNWVFHNVFFFEVRWPIQEKSAPLTRRSTWLEIHLDLCLKTSIFRITLIIWITIFWIILTSKPIWLKKTPFSWNLNHRGSTVQVWRFQLTTRYSEDIIEVRPCSSKVQYKTFASKYKLPQDWRSVLKTRTIYDVGLICYGNKLSLQSV